jgi:propionyl-CoA synthetase
MGIFDQVYEKSLKDPTGFWGEHADKISWTKSWDKVLDDSNPPFYRWFVGGELNTCYNAVDRHVESGRGNQTAIIYDSPVTQTVRKITYQELLDQVSRFAGVLSGLNVGRGDTVIIYMPMIPEALTAMLACARLGAIHSVVFGGFAARELAIRIDDAKPKIIVSASCGIEVSRVIPYKPLLDKAIDLATHKPANCVIFKRPQAEAALLPNRDLDWDDLMAKASPTGCTPVKATDPLYILYTSGTTGIPKGIVRDNGGHAVALYWTMKNIYNVNPGDVYWAASDIGWVVGHSYIVYGPLFHGNTTVVYEGKPVGTPDPGAFWRVISQHNVKCLFTAPTAFRAIKREDPKGEFLKKYDIADFQALFLAGERTDPDTYHWATNLLQKPVIDHWWQTETGWAIAANCLGIEHLPVKPGSPTRPAPGYDVRIVGSDGTEQPNGSPGVVTVKLPLPPGTLPTLWQADDRFEQSYTRPFPGYYFTGDEGFKDDDGYVYIMGRVDDVINVAGHRLSTGAMEEIIAQHQDVAECAVVGVADSLKGQTPVGLVVLKAGVTTDPAVLKRELVQMVRDQIGPVASYKESVIVVRLPKTRSGKILRGTIRKIADGDKYSVPSTIDDPAALDEIKTSLTTIGYAADKV